MIRFTLGSFLAVAFSVVLTGPVSAGEIHFFSESKDVKGDFAEFLALPKKPAELTYEGRTPAGTPCQMIITSHPELIRFEPNIPGRPSFTVERNPTIDILGGTEGDHLWTSYFVDDRGPHFPHGQFGIRTEMDIVRTSAGELSKMEYRKIHQDDMNFNWLYRFDCRNLKLVK